MLVPQAAVMDAVRHELGKGGAPEEEGKRLELLEEAYMEGAAGLEALGFNGIDVSQLELPRVTKRKFNLLEEEKIAEAMKDKNMTAGKLHNLGLTMVNAGVVMEAHKRKFKAPPHP